MQGDLTGSADGAAMNIIIPTCSEPGDEACEELLGQKQGGLKRI